MNDHKIIKKSINASRKLDDNTTLGVKYGLWSLFIVTCILGIYNGCFSFYNGNLIVLAMFASYLGGQSAGKYNVTHDKLELVKAIIGYALGIGALFIYIAHTSNSI